MNREEIYQQCVHKIDKTNCLLLQLPTGFGKTALSIRLANYILESRQFRQLQTVSILILVAKRVHKQTWADEIQKWGGFRHPTAHINVCPECYESMHKHQKEHFNIILADEVHHIGSEMRMRVLRHISFDKFIGLSATIPRQVLQYFKFSYHSEVVSCDITEAIDSEVLPEPTILLFPLQVENTRLSETMELNPKAKGRTFYGEYKDYWKYKKLKVHAVLKCTQNSFVL